ncbi:MAG: tRNA preQ1(34) S-adenosylmethionine ribosyltransferase-isomerase QueA [Phycisphaerae bacterium]|nr:tRNA preQ1(34) S-adenosylmethionine ribosyltransferase-isomerase QueA [Phycisphaerae bacterium]NIR67449.1 tRNA preQ1(34) S-adenosylmethionine ribosyltransferase-isomerase QueA [candidate division Zixibacteria bacterium]NIP51004.1 tRNA preQ1(34) S-adenosylmethionine ribosyltransferase-isomerase QueA [Phycisphaerae bacterium]NIS52736.1 tRNA preQ1(34) S-adenosylmethionine ribosyltransferase-isomerase QueA [Phycisphaerae bacterium]NIU10173.1 tRNA preQ1(34) S-adenosylmethionine ribosyltransferase
MKTDMLQYHLPPELIAQQPGDTRSSSRLLVFRRINGDTMDSRFDRIGDFLSPGDCLVINDTKVLQARFFGRRPTGGKLEGLFLTEIETGTWQVMLKTSRKVKAGDFFYLKDKTKNDYCKAAVLEKTTDGTCRLKIETDADTETILDNIGFPPLPPYIKRDDDLPTAEVDKKRYQTVYAKIPGAVAAPTAGLHFTKPLIEQLQQAGIRLAYITLHVGAGTFKPITTENLEDHKMHQEQFGIDEENTRIINAAKEKGDRIIAVGTTSTRVLETVATDSRIRATSGETRLFIKPGYKFEMVDAMVTNFHLPKSSLLALVAAFAGLENILAAYRHAIEQRYRFYSYGDAMLII